MAPPLFDVFAGGTAVLVLVLLSYRGGALDGGGALSALVIGWLVLGGGGLPWLLLLILFFVLASGFTRMKYAEKALLGGGQGKGGARGWMNAVANGGVAASASLGELLLGGTIFGAAFLGAVSAAASDTLSTEVGLLSRTNPRLILSPSTIVRAGRSGGVTALGLLAGFGTALLLGGASAAMGVITLPPLRVVLIGTVAGMLGSVFDSLLGASVQGLFRCRVCGEVVEEKTHHGTSCLLIGGSAFIDNNVVNMLATGFGAAVAAGLSIGL